MGGRRGESAASREMALAMDEEGTHRDAGPSSGQTAEAVVWKRCCTSTCVFRFRFNGHKHCCSECRHTGALRHSSRCMHEQRLRARMTGPSSAREQGGAASSGGYDNRSESLRCVTAGCNRTTNGTHLHCCSTCKNSAGNLHTRRCQSVNPPAVVPNWTTTAGANVADEAGEAVATLAADSTLALHRSLQGSVRLVMILHLLSVRWLYRSSMAVIVMLLAIPVQTS